MAGKLCTGEVQNNAYHPKNSKAFCEGLQARSLSNAPANPHVVDSEASDAWLRGVDVAAAAAGGAISKSAAPCCAIDQSIDVPA